MLLTRFVYAQTPSGSPSSSAAQDLGIILNRVINYGLGFLVILAVAVIVYIAFLFLTSGGSPEKVQEARKWLLYVVIAVAVGLLSKVFVAIVFELAGEPVPFQGN